MQGRLQDGGGMTSLPAFLEWLKGAPAGTMLSAEQLHATLTPLVQSSPTTTPQSGVAVGDSTPATWHEKLWTVAADVRLGVTETAEALGRPKSFVYNHTKPTCSESDRLPHRKLDGELVFVVGELRQWVREHEETIVAGKTERPSLRRVS